MGFQYQSEAEQFLKELQERFQNFSLELHPEKTRLIRFGRFAEQDGMRIDGKRKPDTFAFLGFTHYCTKTRKGKFKIGRKTICKRLATKLHDVKAELRKRMHSSITEQGKWLKSVVQGYYNYHAAPGNWEAIGSFRT